MISARRINAMRAFILMLRMEDEIDLLCRRPPWAVSKGAFALHIALQQEPGITLDDADHVFDQIKTLIDARVNVLRHRQRQLDKRYNVEKFCKAPPDASWVDTVRAMAHADSIRRAGRRGQNGVVVIKYLAEREEP